MILTGLSLIFAVVIFSGCTAGNYKSGEKASILFERVIEDNVLISDVHAYEDGDTLLIYGMAKRTADNCCDAARGHIDIALVDPDGVILDLISVQYSPRNIPKNRSRSSHFTARLPYTLPEDVHLRVGYHQNEDMAAASENHTEMLICKQHITASRSEI